MLLSTNSLSSSANDRKMSKSYPAVGQEIFPRLMTLHETYNSIPRSHLWISND